MIRKRGMDIFRCLAVYSVVVRADSNDRRMFSVVRKDCLARETA
jgi:hypothetical protein